MKNDNFIDLDENDDGIDRAGFRNAWRGQELVFFVS